ncbi:DUF2812 domain-containing protein [Domibacillus robiginosus]|uniref:DUF2812 domain-containing protein n=1 Tax=Domibacillus robiginosus TaxID=1071054 RepID=UPI00067B7016|nr:DUF2812 domain-containing protein [Domibacillus robiginosus]
MTIKKIRLFLASNIEKEEKWLTDMSSKGFHFQKYYFGVYNFNQNPEEEYIYQIDFNEASQEYFSFYKEAGWKHVDSSMGRFHYFKKRADQPGVKKLYTDLESMKESVQRMLQFYLMMFLLLICSQAGLFLTWHGHPVQKAVAALAAFGVVLYLCLFVSLKKKLQFYK